MARRTATPPPEDFEEHILDTDIRDEMQSSFLEYAYSVIYSRALPDARDGLKPVQRRILYTLNDMGIRPDRGHVKCARVVGEVMGRLHPHGDGAIYDALVRIVQPWSLRLPMVDGHGNFGSPGGDDPPAAMRYTECRMAPPALAMTDSIDEDTVDFRPNYDSRELEPSVLPSAIPNLVVNGTTGIAVGMATNMAPHNLVEVIQALRHLIKHPGTDVDGLMRFIPGPDLPTGGKIVGLDGIRDAYESGRGTFRMRATARIETIGRRKGIVVTELPYGIGTEKVVERIKMLVQGKKLQGIADLKDLTDRVARPAARDRGQERLRPGSAARAALQADADGGHVRHQQRRARRRSAPHARAQGDAERLPRPPLRRRTPSLAVPAQQEGRAAAPRRRPADRAPRHRRGHPGDPHQRRLGGREGAPDLGLRPFAGPGRLHPRDAAAPAHPVLPDRAGEGAGDAAPRDRGARGDPRRRGPAQAGGQRRARRGGQDVRHARAARSCSSRPARAAVTAAAAPLEVPDDPCFALLSSTGLLARTSSDEPVGTGGARANHDVVVSAVRATARGEIGVLTTAGRVVRLGVLDLPAIPPSANEPNLQGGVPLTELISLDSGERALALCTLATDGPGLALGTRHGVVKRVNPEVIGKDEWDVIRLADGDEVVGAVELRTGDEELCFVTSDAQLLHFPASGVRPQGRSGGGMAGVRLAAGERVAWFGALDLASYDDGAVLVTASGSSTALPGTEPGALKVTDFAEYPGKGRATGGVRCHRFLKGEDTLVFAWAGPAPARGAAASGAPIDLPAATGRRDGSGVPGSQPLAACAGPLTVSVSG